MLWKSIQKFICKRKQEESSQVYTFRKVFMRIKKESVLKITLLFLLGLLKIAIWMKRHIIYLLAHYSLPPTHIVVNFTQNMLYHSAILFSHIYIEVQWQPDITKLLQGKFNIAVSEIWKHNKPFTCAGMFFFFA